MIQYLTNPIVVGLLLFGLTYATLYLKEENKVKKYKNAKKNHVNAMIPLVVGMLGYFVAYKCGDKLKLTHKFFQAGGSNVEVDATMNTTTQNIPNNLIDKGEVQIPGPDIFFELANF